MRLEVFHEGAEHGEGFAEPHFVGEEASGRGHPALLLGETPADALVLVVLVFAFSAVDDGAQPRQVIVNVSVANHGG